MGYRQTSAIEQIWYIIRSRAREWLDKKTVYPCLFGKRYIFREGKYVGWYRP